MVDSPGGCSEVNFMAAKRKTHGWKELKLRHLTDLIGQRTKHTHFELSLQHFTTCASLTIFIRTHAYCGCLAGLSIFPWLPS